jgi:hypothetical protein
MDSPVLHMPNGTPSLLRARVIYAVDATGSRSATWEIACDLQAKMFTEAGTARALSLQLVYYGGSYCRASKWCSSGDELARLMRTVHCEAGPTQIGKVLQRGLREHAHAPVQAITFIGDAMEEDLGALSALADELGAAGVPLHMFQEGRDPIVTKAFRLLALKTGGTYSAFNPTVPATIARLSAQLSEVARLAMSHVTAIESKPQSKKGS